VDARSLLDQLFQSGRELAGKGQGMAEKGLGVPEQGPERNAMLSGMGKGALATGALGLLFGTGAGRQLAGPALKIGGLAALGGIAYKAYQTWQANQSDAPAEPGTPVGELRGADGDQRSLALLKAMIAAAKADGHIDDAERAHINGQIQQLGVESDAARFIQQEVDKPLNPKEIAAGADSPEAASEIYLASLLAINVDNVMERAYLGELAKELGIAPGLAAQLEEQAKA
jgi:uncharacterized membrane protein YebE (DUF533 family)